MSVALLACLFACAASDAPGATSSAPAPAIGVTSASAEAELSTSGGRYRLRTTMAPSPPPLSQLFEVRTVVLDAATGAAAPNVTLVVDASMPEHGHGMATRPQTTEEPDGAFITRGMKFHMPGRWVVTYVVDGPAGGDRAQVDVRL